MKEAVKKTKKTSLKTVKTENSNLEAKLFDVSGKEIGVVNLPENIFNVNASDKLLALYNRMFLANNRQGTASTKTRSEVIGSTKKIYRQKGTGRARHGAKKGMSVGGGIKHAPKPRDYSFKLSEKQRRKALLYALTLKFKNNEIIFVDGMSSLKPKTKEVVEMLKNLNITIDNKNLLVNDIKGFESLKKATKNIATLTRMDVKSLNAYVLLANQKVIFDKNALEVFELNRDEK